ncbi:F-box/LRR-repeat protein At3g59190-like isoform X1 [Corylus avellana]|uniref:F-box/LRR-repeat protein At3g59190-like isoform X1 n=1 Tax=Corylus avellana TaxID=13451 RepID=UPI001E1FA717|nr:F-box/LRR-repeat protein At3g59190-like isoform X1 [Corylus avellana]
MEMPTKKLLTITSSLVQDSIEMPTKKQNSGDDVGFSDLPDEVVHHILNFIEMRDVARLSVVSKRCRELCISNPSLCLSNISSISGGPRFNSYVDRFMALRCLHGVKTERFGLRWSFEGSIDQDEEYYRVETWFQNAVNLGGVAQVHLKFILSSLQHFGLPPCLLRCNSLTFLDVDAGYAFLKLPSAPPYFATKLRTLQLHHVQIENDCNLGEMISSFKSLKVLRLDKISGIKGMTITNSSIEILSIVSVDRQLCDVEIQQLHKLYDLNLVWIPKPSSRTSLKISAPNLQKFQWTGFFIDDYCMRDSPDLLQALIGLHLPTQSRGNQASTKHNLVKILHSMQKARHLKLTDCFVEALLKHGCLPFSFDSVEELTLVRTSSSVDQVLPLSAILRGTTNLKFLNLKFINSVKNSMPSGELPFKMGYWQSQNFMFIHQLKKVVVQLFDRENEIELIKYLLTNAQELELMLIFYTSPVSSNVITELRKFKKPLTKLSLRSIIR